MSVDLQDILQIDAIDLELSAAPCPLPAFERSLLPQIRDFRLLTSPPWVRTLGKLTMEVATQGWKFPTPPDAVPVARRPEPDDVPASQDPIPPIDKSTSPQTTRILPPRDTAFAMSVHKSQGSEFDVVAVVLPNESSRVISRELLYTAVSRARERVVICGKEDIIRAAIGTPVERSSGLREALWS